MPVEGPSQPTQLNEANLDNNCLPSPSDLLANLKESRALVKALQNKLPSMFKDTDHIDSALGPALQAAYTGKNIIIFQYRPPQHGPGLVKMREFLGD